MEIETALVDRIEAALRSPQPRSALQKLMNALLDKGYERGDLLPTLESYQASLAVQGRAEDADLILEIIDGLTGWCMTS